MSNGPFTTIQIRRGTAAEWSSINPILFLGEIGLEIDTKKMKIGDGSSTWNFLSYWNDDMASVEDAPADNKGYVRFNNTWVVASGFSVDVNSGVTGSGVTVHSQLLGLDADDHQQYFNIARGDARYYTQTAINSILAGYTPVGHTHSQYIGDVDNDGNDYVRRFGQWVQYSGTSGGGEVEEAPEDSNPYVRQDASWVQASGIFEAPNDGNQYARQNESWQIVTSGIGEAPSDGQQYVRKDEAWSVISGVDGGGITDHDQLQGLADDDHTQYHNDTRGDARYYTQTQLNNGQLDNLYYTETELNTGQLDNRYYTETELNNGQLDNRYYTETEIDNTLASYVVSGAQQDVNLGTTRTFGPLYAGGSIYVNYEDLGNNDAGNPPNGSTIFFENGGDTTSMRIRVNSSNFFFEGGDTNTVTNHGVGNNLYVGTVQAEGSVDSFINFSNNTGAGPRLTWDASASRFDLSDSLYLNNWIQTTNHAYLGGNVYVNHANVNTNSNLYFHNGSAPGNESLRFDTSEAQFIFSDDLRVAGAFSDSYRKFYKTSDTVPGGTTIDSNFILNLDNQGNNQLSTGSVYRVRLNTASTGTETGAVYLVWYYPDTTTWQIKAVSNKGIGSNHPQLAVSGNTHLIAYNNHASDYQANYIVETWYTLDDDTDVAIFGADNTWYRYANWLSYNEGNVAIGGTTTPSAKLHVDGDINITNPNALSFAGVPVLQYGQSLAGYLETDRSLLVGGNRTTSIVRIEATDTAGGNFTTAELQLHGYEGRGKGIRITDLSNTEEWWCGEAYAAQAFVINYGDTGDAFPPEDMSNNTPAFRINTDKRVGINTSTLGYELSVGGDIGLESGGRIFMGGSLSLEHDQPNSNVWVGTTANKTGSSHVTAIGHLASRNLDGTTQYSVFIGGYAGGFASSQPYNNSNSVYVGYTAGYNTISGSNSVGVGTQAARDANLFDQTVAVGYQAGEQSTFTDSVLIGTNAGFSASGLTNVWVGWQAGGFTEMDRSVGIGHQALYGARTGEGRTVRDNTAVGNLAGYDNHAQYGTFIGAQAGYNPVNNGYQDQSVAVGFKALNDTVSTSQVTAVGYYAGEGLTTNALNATLIGSFAGGGASANIENSVYIGKSAGVSNTGGAESVGVGTSAFSSSNAYRSIAIGFEAGKDSTGDNSIYIGHSAGSGITENNQLRIGNYYLNSTPIIQGNLSTNEITFNGTVNIPDRGLPYVEKILNSRGPNNLYTNSTGDYGSNINLNTGVWDSDELYEETGYASINFTTATTVNSIDLISVDPNRVYRMDFRVKSDTDGSRLYAGVTPFDVDGLQIQPQMHMFKSGSQTWLTKDLNPGDTTIHVADASNFYSAAAEYYRRGLVFYNYANSYGHVYSGGTYSRNYSYGTVSDYGGSVGGNTGLFSTNPTDQTSHWEITIDATGYPTGWQGPAIASGTQVANTNSGGNHKYFASNSQIIANAGVWEAPDDGAIIGGVDLTGQNQDDRFPPGTAAVKLLFLSNYAGSSTNQWVSNIYFGAAELEVNPDHNVFYTPSTNEVNYGLGSSENLYVNYDGPDADSYLYFYDNGGRMGQWLRWLDASNYLQTSADLRVGGNLRADGDLYVNYDADGVGNVYFRENGDQTGRYLRWENTNSRFEFNDGVYIEQPNSSIALQLATANQDISFRMGEIGGNFGFRWIYNGTGNGNDNSMSFWAENQSGTEVEVWEVLQDGTTTFKTAVTSTDNFTAANLYSNGNIFVNNDGADVDQTIHFINSTDGNAFFSRGATTGEFFLSDPLNVTGEIDSTAFIRAGSNIIAGNNLYAGYDQAGDSYVYFRDGADQEGRFLHYIDAVDTFRLNSSLIVSGFVVGYSDFYVNNDGANTNSNIYFHNGTSPQSKYIRYSSTVSGFLINDDIDVSGTVEASNVTINGDSLARSTDIQEFTSDGTWTKPTGAKHIVVHLWGGGGGGSSGGKGQANTRGGSGGSGGVYIKGEFDAADLSASESVTVGSAGSGGASRTSTAGPASGTDGGSSIFAGLTALGGSAGTTTAGASKIAANVRVGPNIGIPGNGGAGQNSAAGTAGERATTAGPGGGGGGGHNGFTTQFAGAQGGTWLTSTTLTGGNTGNGSNGVGYTLAGEGGGGGAGSLSGTPGFGGTGGFPAGGGGGGGATSTGSSSGAGGNGGAGWVVVITYF